MPKVTEQQRSISIKVSPCPRYGLPFAHRYVTWNSRDKNSEPLGFGDDLISPVTSSHERQKGDETKGTEKTYKDIE